MIYVHAKYQVKPGMRDAYIKAIRDNRIQQRFEAEPGNVGFHFYIPLDDDQNLCLLDIWEDRAAFEGHLTCDVNIDWAPIKAKYIDGATFDLYEGERNMAYAKTADQIMEDYRNRSGNGKI